MENYQYEYKKRYDHQKRKSNARNIMEKYPDRYPIIIEILPEYRNQINLEKNKYLVQKHMTIGQFIYVIRKHIKIDAEQAIFVFVGNGVLPTISSTMDKIYNEHVDEDKFLYMVLALESTFGDNNINI